VESVALVSTTTLTMNAGCPVRARERCRISPPHFLAECRKKLQNQANFVLLYLVLFTGLCLVFVVSVFDFVSSVRYFPACTNVNCTV